MQLPSAPRLCRGQHDRSLIAVQTAPAAAGVSLLVSWFLHFHLNFVNKKIFRRHHEGKNACHRDAAATAHTAER